MGMPLPLLTHMLEIRFSAIYALPLQNSSETDYVNSPSSRIPDVSLHQIIDKDIHQKFPSAAFVFSYVSIPIPWKINSFDPIYRTMHSI